MVYKHVYLGLLSIGPNDNNLLTEAVKTKHYLVRIVTPFVYGTKEEAQDDPMAYEFAVADGIARIIGLPAELWKEFKEGRILETCPMIDMIRPENWTRYRLLRLKCEPDKDGDWISEIPDEAVKPCGKNWNRLAPAMGRYPIEKVASSIIAFPDVSIKEEERKHAGRGE